MGKLVNIIKGTGGGGGVDYSVVARSLFLRQRFLLPMGWEFAKWRMPVQVDHLAVEVTWVPFCK